MQGVGVPCALYGIWGLGILLGVGVRGGQGLPVNASSRSFMGYTYYQLGGV